MPAAIRFLPRLPIGAAACALLASAFAPPAAARAGAESAPPGALVVFEVRVPAATPAGSVVWISGDRPELGAWSGAGVALRAAGDRRYVGAVRIEAGAAFEFKCTRGSWDTVEKDANGGEIANRRGVAAGAGDTVRVEVAAWRDQAGAPGAPRASTVTGTLRRHAVEGLGDVGGREILVWLPPGYDSTGATRYPVLYFHDGQNVFDAATSFIGVEWGVDESADRLIRDGEVPPFLAVGIPNAGGRRSWEYTPVVHGGREGGGAEAYAQFLIRRVKSLVDGRYPTRPDAASTGTVGSSLGGLVAMYLGLAHPEAFGLVGCVSPAVFWGGREVVRRAAAQARPGMRTWLDIGTREGSMAGWQDIVADTRALRDALVARGLAGGRDLAFVVAPDAEHNERAWAGRTPAILRFLLAGQAPGPSR